ncbi:MAG: cohesin domain-containing protein [Dehalococcoidales bacterium]|nr:cohesin domain-containing protein [Dehalococcoidales bacterium]
MYKIKSLSLICILAALIGAAGFLPQTNAVQGWADKSIISLNAPAETMTNTKITIPIEISQVTDLNAANYRITFDSKIIALENVTDGMIGPDSFPVTGYKEVQPGMCNIVNFTGLNSELTGLTGSGVLSVIHFRTLSKTGTTEINIAKGVLSDIEANSIEADWSGASIRVKAPQSSSGGGKGGSKAPAPSPTPVTEPTPLPAAPSPTAETSTPTPPVLIPEATPSATPPPSGHVAEIKEATPIPPASTPAEIVPPSGQTNWVWVPVLAAIVLLGGVAGFIVIRKKSAK